MPALEPLDILTIAYLQSEASGDTEAADRLYAMRKDPVAIGRLLMELASGEDNASAKFADATGRYGTVLLPLVGDDAEAVLELASKIRQSDLAEKGIEWEPHVTALHGLHEADTFNAVCDVARSFGPIPLTLGNVGVFPANSTRPYDVLKVSVDSPDLHRFNEALATLPHTETNPFNPHATIAYVKPGRGLAYARKFGSLNRSVVVPSAIYSDSFRQPFGVPFGDTAQFADWHSGTSPVTGESGWISTGGQFRKEKPTATDNEPDHEHAARAAQSIAAGALDDLPAEVKSNPGLVAKLKGKVLDAAAALYGRMVLATPYLLKGIDIFQDVTDNPREDFHKLGYNPTLGGVSATGHTMTDPVKDQLGISAHLASTIATKVLGTAIYLFRKKVLGHYQQTQQMADSGALRKLAEVLAGMYTAVNEQLGLPAIDTDTVEAALEKRQAELAHVGGTQQFADGPPGPPPHPGLTWKAETHRWVNPHTGQEHEHAEFPAHDATEHFKAAIAKADIPDHLKADYSASAAHVLSRMSPFALQRVAEHLKGPTTFYKDTVGVGVGVTQYALKLPNLTEQQKDKIRQQYAAVVTGKIKIGGAYLRHEGGQLHLDGGFDAGSGPGTTGVHGGKSQTAREVYGHEWTHAIDGPANQISKSNRWAECYEKEIGPKSAVNGVPRLTSYAHENPAEGLAEFGRLLFAGQIPLERIEQEFPISSKFFKEAKLWPVKAG